MMMKDHVQGDIQVNWTLPAAFAIGTIWGSFTHTLLLRSIHIEKGFHHSLFTGRSRCPACGVVIPWYGLIPLAGFLLLRGRCRHCGTSIPWHYPLSEIIWGTVALFIVMHFGISLYSLGLLLTGGILYVIAAVDSATMRIPDHLLLLLIPATLPLLPGHWMAMDALKGAALSGGLFLLVLLIFPGSFGGGDLKLAVLMGALLGLERTAVMMEVAIISGAFFGVVYSLIKKKKLNSAIPFGPFLVLGFSIAWLWGDRIILWYLYMTRSTSLLQ